MRGDSDVFHPDADRNSNRQITDVHLWKNFKSKCNNFKHRQAATGGPLPVKHKMSVFVYVKHRLDDYKVMAVGIRVNGGARWNQ